MIVVLLMLMMIGLIIFNYKLDISMANMSYIIVGVAIISIMLIAFTYNSHSECDALINHNNMTLQALQDKCYQYIST